MQAFFSSMKTLIITSSIDATVDLLINDLGTKKFIRINYDRPNDWQIKLTNEYVSFHSDELNVKVTDEEIKKCIWRKPFQRKPESFPYDDQYYMSEWKYLLYDLYFFFHDNKKTFLNPPLPDYLFTKHMQSRKAVGIFDLPKTITSINIQPNTETACVVKSMSGETFSNGNIMYTVDVEKKDLDKNIWTIQDKVIRGYDLTVAYLYGSIYAYQLDRKKIQGLDWRVDIDKHDYEWEHIDLDEEFSIKIKKYMRNFDLNYGRLDFLADYRGKNPIFLELNRNGQWAWLDRNESTGLYIAMKNVYDPEIINQN
jgi:hypothetical protein